MSESKISCPHCTQHIALDAAWAGQTVNCPACQKPFVVPGTPPMAQVVTPAAPPAPGLRISSAAAAQPSAPPAGSAGAAPPQSGPGTKISGLAIASLVLSLLGCFFITAIAGVICGHMARGRIRANRNLSGGGLALAGLIIGYIFIALMTVQLTRDFIQGWNLALERRKAPSQQQSGRPGSAPAPARNQAGSNLKVTSRAPKPADPVAGTVYGTPFTYTRSMLQWGGTLLEIDSREGTPNDQVIVISLPTGGAQSLTNRAWHITQTTAGIKPTITVARLGVDLHGRPVIGGYQMELTFGAMTNGIVPGTIKLKATGAIAVDIKGNFNATFD